MTENNPFQQHALDAVVTTIQEKWEESTLLTMGTYPPGLKDSDFYVVWFVKVLQNWKALVSTDAVSGLYFEVTYNGDRLETYVDWYEKKSNTVVSDAVLTTDYHHLSD